MAHPAAPNVLSYVSGPGASPPLAWRVAFWLGVTYLLLLGAFLALQAVLLPDLLRLLDGAPLREPFLVALLLREAAPPALAAMNLLPVLGYAAGLRGRSPRRFVLPYAAVQGCLIAALLAATVYIVWHGPLRFTSGGGTSTTLALGPLRVVVAGAASLLLSLPLLALLIPRARRACLGQGRSEQGN